MKTKELLPFILFPYLLLVDLVTMFGCGNFSESQRVLLVSVCALILLLNVVNFVFAVFSFVKIIKLLPQTELKRLLPQILKIKFFHIPYYILMFTVGLSMAIMPMGIIITAFCFLFDCLSIGLSGILVLVCLIYGIKNGLIERKSALIYGILSFLFCVDILAAIHLTKKSPSL